MTFDVVIKKSYLLITYKMNWKKKQSLKPDMKYEYNQKKLEKPKPIPDNWKAEQNPKSKSWIA